VSGTNPERAVTPVVTDDICAQFTLEVASGSSRAVAIQIEDGQRARRPDVDQMTLVCTRGLGAVGQLMMICANPPMLFCSFDSATVFDPSMCRNR
jgi:hypothetical protein